MSTNTLSVAAPSRAWHIGLWVGQILLALLFAFAGYNKLVIVVAEAVKTMPAIAAIPEPLLRFIGVAEVAGALGLILPAATRILPILTAWAAVGLAVVMALATAYHVNRGEPAIMTIVLMAIAALIAWGRFKKAPIAPRA